MKRYGQYCPVARAAEVLAERWTLLVVRELLCGSERFTEIARGVPRMSPTLLAARLRELQRAGLVRRDVEAGQPRYRLTAAGAELRPLVELMGTWGQRWMHALRPDDVDASLLVLDVSRQVDPARLPVRAAVVHLHLPAAPPGERHWWLVLGREGVEACNTDPGLPVAVRVCTDAETLTRVWLGEVSWARALAKGALQVSGEPEAVRALPGWIGVSSFAAVARAPVALPR